MKVAVVLAGGSGSRSGEPTNKTLIDLAGTPVLRRSVDAMLAGGADAVVVVVRAGDHAAVRAMLAGVDFSLAEGGATRQQSEAAGVAAAADLGATTSADVIAVHDAARPLVSADLVATVFGAAEHGAAYPSLETHGLWLTDDAVGPTPIRPVPGTLRAAQTPQAARADLLHDAYLVAGPDTADATDTVDMLMRHAVSPTEITPVAGDPRNVKLTWPEDFVMATRLLTGAATGESSAVQSSLVQPTDVAAPTADSGLQSPSDTASPSVEPLEGVTPDSDAYGLLGAVEGDIADAQRALECLAVEGDEICTTCRAALDDGSLARRPALARCVEAKRS